MKTNGMNEPRLKDAVEFAIFLHELACRAQGQRKDAELACLLSIRLLEKTVGPDHPYIGEALSTLEKIRSRPGSLQPSFHVN